MLVIPQINTSDVVLHFLLDKYKEHADKTKPLIVGLSGLQGSGKSYTVNKVKNALSSPPHNYRVVVFSIDDLYYDFNTLEKLRMDHPDNALLSHRGEPGTHDIELGSQILESLIVGKETKIPFFDKSLHSGRGDRVPETEWSLVKRQQDPSSHNEPVADIVLLEGWCIGFRALSDEQVKNKWETSTGTLQHHKLEHLLWVNNALKQYDMLTDKFDVFVHLDTAELSFVYDWRIQQEHDLIKMKGNGMTDEEVRRFIAGYMPGYELYLDKVRTSVIKRRDLNGSQRQLRVVLGKDRNVESVEVMKIACD